MCLVPECDSAIVARELCSAHYQRWKRHGDPLAGNRRRPSGLTEIEVFAWFMPGQPPDSGCWDWGGSVVDGYGHFYIDGKFVKAHRVAYHIYHGRPPLEGLDVLHSCDRPICCQPAHLEEGTHAKNMSDAALRRRMAHGEQHYKAKLTEVDVQWIREQSGTLRQKDMADALGVHQSTVSKIQSGEWWKS